MTNPNYKGGAHGVNVSIKELLDECKALNDDLLDMSNRVERALAGVRHINRTLEAAK